MTGRPVTPPPDGGDAWLGDGLGALLGDTDAAFRADVEASATRVDLRGGDILFREGDPADAAYVVLAGRLRAVVGPAGDERALSDALRGETVGELALLTQSPRSATVYAVRDSVVARVAATTFEALLRRHPSAALPITRLLAVRLRQLTAAAPAAAPSRLTVSVLGIGAVDAAAFATRLAAAIDPLLPAVVVRSSDVAGSTPGSCASALDELETRVAVAVYAGEPGWTAWNEVILRRGDEILLVADALDDPTAGLVDGAVFAPRERGGPRVTLVLRQPPGRDHPVGTARWLADRPVDRHLHVRGDDASDLARVGRWVTGRSTGLVLGGGGARGWAHIGAVRALREAGVPVDFVGGTSQGALVGAAVADRHEPEAMLEMAVGYIEHVRDYTPPVVSVIRGGRILRGIRRLARPGAGIEDLWLPYFAVATNLSRAELAVIERGSVEDAIRASVSLPVILPPVVRDGDLWVDGGLLDNLPIGPMRARLRTGPIIAVDASPRRIPIRYDPLPADVSGWSLLADRLLRRSRRRTVPGLGDIVQQTVVAGSNHLRRSGAPDPDALILSPDLGDWALLDFGAMAVIAEAGYQAMRDPIRSWWAERQGDTVRSRGTPP